VCLGIPGQVTELLAVDPGGTGSCPARVEVNGVGRVVDIGLLADEAVGPGDWVLIHVGFALARIDEDEARDALERLRDLGED
jgi:hydrogenase expression/formation protein HypC